MTHNGPRNGTSYVGLLVGGNSSILHALRGDLYAEFGIELRQHWLTERDVKLLHREIEVVLILTDFCSHGLSRQAVRMSKMMRVRYALIGRKKSAWLTGLQKSGFVQHPSWLKAQQNKGEIMTVVNGVNEATGTITLNTVDAAPERAATQVRSAVTTTPAAAIDYSARYVTVGHVWAEADISAVVRIFESWPNDNDDGIVEAVWKATGHYRPHFTLSARARFLLQVTNIRIDLVRALERTAARQDRIHKAFLAEEKLRIKRGDPLPAYLSCDAAALLIARPRLRRLARLYDRVTSTLVYRRDDVLSRLRDARERGIDPAAKKLPRITPSEWKERIVSSLKERGPMSWSALTRGVRSGDAVRAQLLSSGAIEEKKIYGWNYYRLPGQNWPARLAPGRKARDSEDDAATFQAGERLVMNAEAVTLASKPAQPVKAADDSAARADIYRAMRDKELTPAQAVELLRLLNG